jgi:hypothetical protein
MMRILVIVVLAFVAAGCATITKGTTQVVAVSTPGVSGATCTLMSPSVGSQVVVTPATVSLPKGRDAVSVRCEKECYQEGAGIIASNTEGMTAGNILVGGVIGLGVDAASGAMNSYSPEVQVVMTPIQGCRTPAPPSARRT